jgi:hypothetical protein
MSTTTTRAEQKMAMNDKSINLFHISHPNLPHLSVSLFSPSREKKA